MKLKDILLGQSIRLIRLLQPVGGLYIPDFIKLVQNEFKFVTVPKSLADCDLNKGITFEHGLFNVYGKRKPSVSRSVVIDRFQIFSNGLLAEARSYVEDVDSFLEEVIAWSIRVLGVRHDTEALTASTYVSNVEVEMSNPFALFHAKAYEGLAKALSKRFSEYGLKVAPYGQIGFALHADTVGLKAPFPTNFRIERREGFEFSSNVYFSTAPLKTQHHLDLLKEIESGI